MIEIILTFIKDTGAATAFTMGVMFAAIAAVIITGRINGQLERAAVRRHQLDLAESRRKDRDGKLVEGRDLTIDNQRTNR